MRNKYNVFFAILLGASISLSMTTVAKAENITKDETVQETTVVQTPKAVDKKDKDKEKISKVWEKDQPRMSYEDLLSNIKKHNVKKVVFSESIYEFGNVKLELNNGIIQNTIKI